MEYRIDYGGNLSELLAHQDQIKAILEEAKANLPAGITYKGGEFYWLSSSGYMLFEATGDGCETLQIVAQNAFDKVRAAGVTSAWWKLTPPCGTGPTPTPSPDGQTDQTWLIWLAVGAGLFLFLFILIVILFAAG
jgi:hypothetical protein